jgi:C4-dicarboxylate-specific signal transduction histidine kinase
MNGIESLESVHHRPRELTIRSETYENDHVLVSVRDSGIDIEPKIMDRLFQAFFTTNMVVWEWGYPFAVPSWNLMAD